MVATLSTLWSRLSDYSLYFYAGDTHTNSQSSKLPPKEQAYYFTAIAIILAILAKLQEPSGIKPTFLPIDKEKREYEVFVLKYSILWMLAFGSVVAFQIYEAFDATAYNLFCGALALPLVLRPFFHASPSKLIKRRSKPIAARHSTRAQLWILIFSFIGNYWYTHYFYSVLRARYTMPAWRLNGVPICMYFATHFYFCSYHVLSNLILRRIHSSCAPGARRMFFVAATVCAMAYTTAFMETLTISHFPYYDFEDRDMAYTVGSAFYGLYFVVSFPAYFSLDERTMAALDGPGSGLLGVSFSSLGCGMLVLLLLDFVRLLFVGRSLSIGGDFFVYTPAL